MLLTERGWSAVEVEAVVADYFAMLDKELRGEAYNKTFHRRLLSAQLNGRSDGSIERKHQNISAILIEFGHPYISGYKPLRNYQGLLREAVTARLAADQALAKLVSCAVEAPARLLPLPDILGRFELPPISSELSISAVHDRRARYDTGLPTVNFLERESRNQSLGRAGEEFVVNYERVRLESIGAGRLAERVEHVAVTEGDSLGFDVRSFEEDGSDRLIEVKTTAYGKHTPFFVSRNEVQVSSERSDRYHLYRVFRFRADPRLYTLEGSLNTVCRLEAVQYEAYPN